MEHLTNPPNILERLTSPIENLLDESFSFHFFQAALLSDDLIEVLKHTVVPEHEKRVSFEALRSFAFFR